jgi:hypothetical protein
MNKVEKFFAETEKWLKTPRFGSSKIKDPKPSICDKPPGLDPLKKGENMTTPHEYQLSLFDNYLTQIERQCRLVEAYERGDLTFNQYKQKGGETTWQGIEKKCEEEKANECLQEMQE